jgi:hypothetical protein
VGKLLVLLLVVLVVLGFIVYTVSQRTWRDQALQGRKAAAMSFYNRLGSDVATLDPGADPVSRQALADAAERYTSAGSMFATADTEGEIATARRTALEGLIATRLVRERLGLPPGPDLPPLDYAYGQPQLEEPRRVAIEGQQVEGYPDYRPGAPYRWPGGHGVPGGWYPFPVVPTEDDGRPGR